MATSAPKWLLKVFSGPHTGAEIVLTEGEHLIGSGDECDVILDDPGIAPQHAKFAVQGNTVTCTAFNGAKTYVEGQPASDVALQPYQFVTVGDTHLAVGPDGSDWPTRDLPTIQPSDPAETAAEASDADAEDSADTEAAETEPSAQPQREKRTPPAEETRTKRGGTIRWLVSLIILLLLIGGGVVVFANSDWFKTKPVATPTANKDDLEKIVQQVAPDSSVQIHERDGGFAAKGHVMSDETARKLEDALLDAHHAIDIADIADMESIEENARGLLQIRKLNKLKVDATNPGELTISGLLPELSEWSKAIEEIKARTKVDLVDEVKTPEGKSLAEAPAAVMPPTPELNAAEVTDNGTESAGGTKSGSGVTIEVRDVTIGRSRFFTTTSGLEFHEGSAAPGGFEVKTIARDHAVLSKDGQQDVTVYFKVQP